MADRTELSADVENLNVDYLAEHVEDDESLLGLQDYFIPPTLKKLEATSKQRDLVQEFGAGSIILTPQNTCVWKQGDKPFKFVPILFVPIIRKWVDLKDPEGPNVIDTSFDVTSNLAKIARDPEKRNAEEYGNGFHYQYVEHLTFLGVLYDGEFAGTQCVLSFERSGHFKGKGFLTAIQSRRVTVNEKSIKQPLWAQVWGIELIAQSNQFGNWFGFNFKVVTPSVIEQQYVQPFKEMHISLKELQKQRNIIFEDESTANDITTKSDTMKKAEDQF